MIRLVDVTTGKIIGRVVTNRSLTFDELCKLAGLTWITYPSADTSGWYKNGVLYTEQDIRLEHRSEQ